MFWKDPKLRVTEVKSKEDSEGVGDLEVRGGKGGGG